MKEKQNASVCLFVHIKLLWLLCTLQSSEGGCVCVCVCEGGQGSEQGKGFEEAPKLNENDYDAMHFWR